MAAPQAAHVVEVAVGDPGQLFEPLDASPAAHRHLEEKVEQFILREAEERRAGEYALVVRVPAAAISSADEMTLGEGIRHHFGHRADEESARLRALIRDGRRDVMIGLVFLFICGLAGLFALRLLPRALGIFVEQGVLILGWVALWRPVDLFLYELRPLRRRRDLLKALARMDVRFERARDRRTDED